MPVERNTDGVIINAGQLTSHEVVLDRVLCPGCQNKVFKKWPLGWDAHAAFICEGVKGHNEAKRKTDFKQQFSHLFR